jgi:hypothetical protein
LRGRAAAKGRRQCIDLAGHRGGDRRRAALERHVQGGHFCQLFEKVFGLDVRSTADAVEPKVIGLPSARLIKSGRSCAGLSGLVMIASGLDAAFATVVKSPSLNGLFLCSVSLIASAGVVTRSVQPSGCARATDIAAGAAAVFDDNGLVEPLL